MENLMNAMMLSCVKATELMEMKEYIPAGVIRTMQLTMQLLCAPVARII